MPWAHQTFRIFEETRPVTHLQAGVHRFRLELNPILAFLLQRLMVLSGNEGYCLVTKHFIVQPWE